MGSECGQVVQEGSDLTLLSEETGVLCVKDLLLKTFYASTVWSVISTASVCWGSSISAKDFNRLNKIVRMASLGPKLDKVQCQWS